MDESGRIELEQGWALIDERGFKPLAAILDLGGDYRGRHGGQGPQEWSRIYTTVYKMCIQRPPRAYAEDLYMRVEQTLSTYLRQSTLPALHAVHGEFMLRELGRRWANHKLMVRWVTRTFSYVDRYYVKRHERPSLEHVGYTCFKRDVFDSIAPDVRTAALNIVCRERDGEAVDRALLKAVLGIFAEMGMGKLDVYTEGWERHFLEDTAEFYRRASARWAEEDSFPDYMRKVDACINEERERAEQYLNQQTKERLQRVCERELLTVHQQSLLDKENSGLVALLENNKREDLKLLYKLYSRVQNGLGPIGQILKNHIKKEGMELVREQRARIETAKAAEALDKTTSPSGAAEGGASSADASSASTAMNVPTSGSAIAKSGTTMSHAAASAASGTAVSLQGKPDFIQSLLSLHDRYMDLVNNCFDKHVVFNKAMKEAFERFVNEQVGDASTAQLFANFCDSLLNSTGVGAKMNEVEVEIQLEKLVKLFTYLSEKDVYQEFCRKQLAKRLLLDRSHSDDAERFLIGKLKQSCGSHFTSKLEGMITDMNVSRDTQTAFYQWNMDRIQGKGGQSPSAGPSDVGDGVVTNSSDAVMAVAGARPSGSPSAPSPGDGGPGSACMVEGVDFSVRVLTTGHWPTYTEDKLVVPPQIEACTSHFKAFYNSRTSQRVLRWVYGLGKATLESRMFVGQKPFGKVELHVSTHQMCILLMFNDRDTLSYDEVWEAIRSKAAKDTKDAPSGEELVKASIWSLTTKYPLLLKEPKSRELKSSDVFLLNTRYVSPRKRITIPMPTAKISEEEREAAHETVVEDRRHAIEAAIVRVMKQHKILEHQMLIMEVSKLCNPVFKPEPRAIKSRIEELINREYLQREEGSSSCYKYLA
jgi:cullin 1